MSRIIAILTAILVTVAGMICACPDMQSYSREAMKGCCHEKPNEASTPTHAPSCRHCHQLAASAPDTNAGVQADRFGQLQSFTTVLPESLSPVKLDSLRSAHRQPGVAPPTLLRQHCALLT